MPAMSISGKWFAAFPELAGLNDAAALAALEAATSRVFPTGTKLIHQGDRCAGFLMLARGTVRIFEIGEGGREIVLYRVRAGEICVLTLSELCGSHTYRAEAVSEDEVEVVNIPETQFRHALAQSEAFRTFVFSVLVRRLSEVMGLVEQLVFQRLDLRLACRLGQLFGERRTERIKVTHHDLARDLGTSREVISRLLKEFEQMGCINLGRGEIALLSADALARLSGEHIEPKLESRQQ